MLRKVCTYVVTGLLALVLALSLAGCGGYGNHDKGNKTKTGNSGY
jgi:hypothetical protein